MSKRKITILISAAVFIIAASLMFWKFTKSPEYIIMTGSNFEKRQVIKFLHKKPRWRTIRMLVKLLNDQKPEIRILAAGCAGEYGYNELTDKLAEMSEFDTDDDVRAQCLHRAVQLQSDQSSEIIQKGLKQEKSAIILNALASIVLMDPPDPSLCIPLLTHSDSRIREQALQTAVALKARDAVPILANDLDSEELFGLPELLDALQNITGVNHGTDPDAWHIWYKQQSKPQENS